MILNSVAASLLSNVNLRGIHLVFVSQGATSYSAT